MPDGSMVCETGSPALALTFAFGACHSGMQAMPSPSAKAELRIDCGPGYRVYFVQRANVLIVLLAGGDKSTQDKDIKQAKALARDLTE